MSLQISHLRRWFAAGAIGLLLVVAAVYFYARNKVQNALKEVPAKRLRPTRADWMLREAVLGMLPKNKLRALRAKKLRIYLDDKGLQRHTGQKPQLLAQ